MTSRAGEGLLPLFPLELVLYPGASLPLHIFEPRYRQMIAACLEEGSAFGVVLETDGERSEVGCTAEIRSVLTRYPDGRLDILTEGRRRFRLLGTDEEMPYLRGSVDWLDEEPEPVAAERARVVDLYRRTFWAHGTGIPPSHLEEAPFASYVVARSNLLGLADRQRLLEMPTERMRLEAIARALTELEPVVTRWNGNGHG